MLFNISHETLKIQNLMYTSTIFYNVYGDPIQFKSPNTYAMAIGENLPFWDQTAIFLAIQYVTINIGDRS